MDDPEENRNRSIDDGREKPRERKVDRQDDRNRSRKKRDQGFITEIYQGDDESTTEG
ncbi:MAG: hypothetical protein OXG09_11490 [Chloroflexi bacterium]|nr:hypothetical protein [Chloroflexota bacterium]